MRYLIITIIFMMGFSYTYAQTEMTVPDGSGTVDDPYQITTLGNLSWMTQASGISYNKSFVQLNDIDASETKFWDRSDDNSDGDRYNDANDLTSEGDNDGWAAFGGEIINSHYNGKGHCIDGLSVNGGEYAAFFNTMTGCKIENLGITNVNFNGIGSYSGALVGYFKGDSIINCYSSGVIKGSVSGEKIRIGGLVGHATGNANNIVIENCHSSVNIDSCQNYIGGLIGNIKGVLSAKVVNCYAVGNITNCEESVGGFIGKIENTTVDEESQLLISHCYATGDVTADLYVGGFVGYLYDKMEMDNRVVVEDCYSRGSLEQLNIVHYSSDPTRIKDGSLGGFIGYNCFANIRRSYSIGSVVYLDTVAAFDRGLLGKLKTVTKDGYEVGEVVACFFDSSASNQISDIDSTVNAMTTEEMMRDTTFINAGWDFENVWEIVGENYPTFKVISSAIKGESGYITPAEYTLNQNYPNPFNPTTVIGFSLSQNATVDLTVYNLLGQKVAELVNGKMVAGYHEVSFNAANLSSGVYVYRLKTGDFVSVKKMMLLK